MLEVKGQGQVCGGESINVDAGVSKLFSSLIFVLKYCYRLLVNVYFLCQV